MCRRLMRAGVRRTAIERPDGPVVDALIEAGLEVVVVASGRSKHSVAAPVESEVAPDQAPYAATKGGIPDPYEGDGA